MSENKWQHDDSMRKIPVQKRAERTLWTIFEAAAQIVNGEGEQALTTNRVAERSGYSVGTIYQYFPDKTAIVLTLFRFERSRVIEALQALLAEAQHSEAHPAHYLRLYVRTVIKAFAVGRHPRRTLLKMAWRLDTEPEVLAAMQEMAERIGEALLSRAHPSLREPNSTLLFVVTRGVMGVLRSAVLEDFPHVAEPEFEDELVRMAWAMIGEGVPLP